MNGSSTSLHLEDGSVQYVFTDPPFGDYIPYAEINQLNEVWLGQLTDRDAEIIVSNAGGKDVSDRFHIHWLPPAGSVVAARK